MKNKNNNIIFVLACLVLLASKFALSQNLVINEAMYSNKGFLLDQDNDSPDWIEIYNGGGQSINLKNWQLTDDASDDEFWTFPSYILGPGEHMIVFASGKDRYENGAFHTDFKLGLMEESIYLVSPLGEIVSSIAPSCAPANLCLGRKPDGSDSVMVLHPTPGTSNNNAETVILDYKKDSLILSHSPGFYEEPFHLSLSHQNPGNTIHYSLDGSEPDEESPVYKEPLLIEDLTPNENRFANIDPSDDYIEPGDLIFKGTPFRAVVYSEGCPASRIETNVYFVNKKLKGKYDVPVVSLITDPDNLFDDETGIYVKGNHNNFAHHGKKWEREVHVEVFDKKGHHQLKQNCGARIHGRGSRGAPQKSFRLYAREEYGQAYFDFPFLEQKPQLRYFKRLLLRRIRDWSEILFKDELCQHLVEDMNIDYAASETVIAFVNGEYWGIYNLRERHDRYYVETNYGIKDPDLDIIGYDKHRLVIDEGNLDKYYELVNFLQYADVSSNTFYQEACKWIDIDALMDFYIAQLYLSNTDFPDNNLEMWRIKSDTAKWRYFFFDMDAAMIRITNNHLAEYTGNEDFHTHFAYSTFILRTLLKNDEFCNQFYLKFLYHLKHTFSAERVLKKIAYYEELYTPMVGEHIYRWGRPVDIKKWKHNVDMLKQFAAQRPSVLLRQLQNSFKNPFVISPNPSNGTFYVKTTTDKTLPYRLEIFSITGKKVFYKDVSEHSGKVLINTNLRNGLFLVRIEYSGFYFTQKLAIL